jgi:hypothetical protein
MLLYSLKSDQLLSDARSADSPPELFHTIKCDDALNILHPSLRSSRARRLWKGGGGREGRYRSLGQIAAFGGW